MKPELKEQARSFRKTGLSVNQIAFRLGVSKSSVSTWVRDIVLTPDQQRALRQASGNGIWRATEVQQQRVQTRRNQWREEAEAEWPQLSQNPAFMFGLALYLGEGGKTNPYSLRFSNADPGVVRKAIQFYELLGICREQLRLLVQVANPALVPPAEEFWVQETGLPREQFTRTAVAQSSASQKKRQTIPYGTLRVYAGNVQIRQKLERWMQLALR